jgi:hypothetical protein
MPANGRWDLTWRLKGYAGRREVNSDIFGLCNVHAIIVLVVVVAIIKIMNNNKQEDVTVVWNEIKKGKVHPCVGTEALYRPYGS